MLRMTAEILREINRIQKEKEFLVVAIDGRCASGKTTLANDLQSILACNVFHMDDFFLRPEQRTGERYAEPGGNVDRERFREEVLRPLLEHRAFSYRPFDCHTLALRDFVAVEPKAAAVVEGTYSCHPMLWDSYDLHIFLSVPSEEQMARVKRRNGEDENVFRERWIPLEERYFEAYAVEERCELKFHPIDFTEAGGYT